MALAVNKFKKCEVSFYLGVEIGKNQPLGILVFSARSIIMVKGEGRDGELRC